MAALYTALEGVGPVGEVSELVKALESLRPRVDAFYDDVLVNDPDQSIRSARQALVQKVVALAEGVAEPRQLELLWKLGFDGATGTAVGVDAHDELLAGPAFVESEPGGA